MRHPDTEALLTSVREAVTEARRGGVTVEACLWNAAVAAVDKGAHGVPSPEARCLADGIRRGMQPSEIAVKDPIDPLSAQCPACLADPGEQCYATSTDEPRRHPHRLRGLAAAKRLVQCETCHGIGWRPEGEHTDIVKPREDHQ